MPLDPLDELRTELRRLYRLAPGGVWTAPGEQAVRGGITTTLPDGRRSWIGAFFYGEDAARFVVAARAALPVLWRALDDARAERSVPVLGTVGDGGAIAWRTAPPDGVGAHRTTGADADARA